MLILNIIPCVVWNVCVDMDHVPAARKILPLTAPLLWRPRHHLLHKFLLHACTEATQEPFPIWSCFSIFPPAVLAAVPTSKRCLRSCYNLYFFRPCVSSTRTPIASSPHISFCFLMFLILLILLIRLSLFILVVVCVMKKTTTHTFLIMEDMSVSRLPSQREWVPEPLPDLRASRKITNCLTELDDAAKRPGRSRGSSLRSVHGKPSQAPDLPVAVQVSNEQTLLDALPHALRVDRTVYGKNCVARNP